jgi:uncharacterized protein YcfJ
MTHILGKAALALALMFAAVPVPAAEPAQNTSYGYAQVLRVEPVYEVRTVQAVDPECLRPERGRAPPGRAVGGCVPRSVTVRRIVAYDVEYSYKGETYMSRLSFDPGSRLRIRISVTPDESSAPRRVAPTLDG